MIYILTGPIRSGKTTALKNWILDKNHVDGILSPDDASGKRYFYAIKDQQTFLFEAEDDNTEDVIEVGKFKFLRTAFNDANAYLNDTFNKNAVTITVLDELGKLELKSLGLYDSATQLIHNCENSKESHLLLVIRDTLLEAAIGCFNINSYVLVDKASLSTTIA